jgi:hypothetical protein
MKASVRKDLMLRLNKLEHRLTTKRTWPGILLVTERIDRERLMTLAEGERVVLDWYQCSHPGVGFLWARERIATNASDLGSNMPAGPVSGRCDAGAREAMPTPRGWELPRMPARTIS